MSATTQSRKRKVRTTKSGSNQIEMKLFFTPQQYARIQFAAMNLGRNENHFFKEIGLLYLNGMFDEARSRIESQRNQGDANETTSSTDTNVESEAGTAELAGSVPIGGASEVPSNVVEESQGG